MKKILCTSALLSVAIISSVSFAEYKTLDCEYAAQTAAHSVELKQSGVTLEQFNQSVTSMPNSHNKNLYVFFTNLGYQYKNKQQAYENVYNKCIANVEVSFNN